MDENVIWQENKVSYEDRCRSLGQQGCVFWLTGLSGSGKSTVAVEAERRLHALGKHVYLLDGDNIRHGLNADLGFSDADRIENIRRVIQTAKLFADAGLITLVSFITPFEAMRRSARAELGNRYHEIYVKADLETCAARDPKGLYARRVSNFTGIASPYETPEHPDLVLDTQRETVEQSVEKLLRAVLAAAERPRDAMEGAARFCGELPPHDNGKERF